MPVFLNALIEASQDIAQMAAVKGVKAVITPMPVATPLPPLKLKKIGKL